MEESYIIPDIDIVDNLIKNSSKLKVSKYYNKINSLLEQVICKLTNTQINLKNVDEYQLWNLIEFSTKDKVKNYRDMINQNVDNIILKEINQTKLNLEKKFTSIKRERNFEDDIEEDIEEDQIHNSQNEEEYNDDQLIEDNKDEFFNMDEFNKIADQDFENVNLDNDDDDEEEIEETDNKVYKYNDFFNNTQNKESNDIEIDDEEIENNIFDIEDKIIKQDEDGIKKNYIINDNQNIEEIEKIMMDNKPWHMKGEVRAKQRPKESLLENFLDFQVTIKPPPIPSIENSDKIEKIIKMRIKDELFDDPIRKSQINLNNKEKQEIEIEFDKTKKGLGELYEEDYNNQNVLTSENDKVVIKKEIDDLCSKLYNIFDKLTNNNFVSGNRSNEMKVITNIPAIQMEDISQFVTDNKKATQSAFEIFNKKDMETKTKDEMTTQDNKTSHKKWKRNVRNKLRQKERDKKLNSLSKQFDSKFETKMAFKQHKDIKAKKNIKNSELKSTKFFGNLQNILSDDIHKKNNKRARNDIVSKDIKSYKL